VSVILIPSAGSHIRFWLEGDQSIVTVRSLPWGGVATQPPIGQDAALGRDKLVIKSARDTLLLLGTLLTLKLCTSCQ
jgi:hypothetical protein